MTGYGTPGYSADPECSDPDCIEGVYTAEEIAAVVLAAGWQPPRTSTHPCCYPTTGPNHHPACQETT